MKTGIQFATHKEAVPFLTNATFEPVAENPFPLYKKDGIYLIISGIGKVNSAIAASFLISQYKTGRMINLGSAGSLTDNYKIGDVLQINKSVEYDGRNNEKPRHKFLTPNALDGIPSASLVTSDSPVITLEERKRVSRFGSLVDMEGASFMQACRAFNSEAYLFKVISDIPGDTELKVIIKNIKETRTILYIYMKENAGDILQL